MLDSLVASARASNLTILTLSVGVGNDSARRLYRRAGFISYGTGPNSLMIGSKLVDEELMALPLRQP